MSKNNKINKIINIHNLLFNSTDSFFPKTKNSQTNILFYKNKNTFPPLIKSYDKRNIREKFWNESKTNKMSDISKTFYSIKCKLNHLMPRTKSLVYKYNNKFNDYKFKNIFHYDSFQNIRNNIHNQELNKEFNEKKRKYNLLLFNLIKDKKNSKKDEINIKYDLINKMNKNIIKKKNEKIKNDNKKILKILKKLGYINFKKDIGVTLKRKDEIDKKIRNILDNVETKFDNVFNNEIKNK